MFSILTHNFVILASILGMMVFICVNHVFSRRISKLFILFYINCLCLYFADVFDMYYSQYDYGTVEHFLATAAGYICRPLALIFCINIVNRRKGFNSFLFAFIFIDACLVLSSYYTHFVFWYSDFNVYQRGPFGYLSHTLSGVLGLVLIYYSFINQKNINLDEGWVISFIVCISFISTTLENVYGYDFILSSAISVSGIFYYMFLHSQLYKTDQLTGVLNRRCFFIDLKQSEHIPMALISCDMNGLKYINDTYGHLEGDRAILTFANALIDSKTRNYLVYRIGGDEFMVIGKNKSQEQAMDYIRRAQKILSETEYSVSFGFAMYKEGDNIEEIQKRADDRMYKNKRFIKNQEMNARNLQSLQDVELSKKAYTETKII